MLTVSTFYENVPVTIAHTCSAGMVRFGNATVFNGVAADCRRVIGRRHKPNAPTFAFEGSDRLFSALKPALDVDF